MASSISSAENSFFSVAITLYLFFKYYPMKNRLEQIYFQKRSYVWATWSFYINPAQQKIHRRWVDNLEVIHCKKLYIRSSCDDSGVIHFCSFMLYNKNDHKKYDFVLVSYLFWNISSFKSEKGDTAKLSHTRFIFKQKR